MNKTRIINPNKLLPIKYRIPNAGNHMFEYGFIRYRIGDNQTNVSKYNQFNKRIIKLIFLLNIIKFFTSAYIKDTQKYRKILLMIGDVSIGFESIRTHYNILFGIIAIFGFLTQLLHERFSSPSSSWLRPFAMMKGLIKPSDIELNNSNGIIKLLKR